MCVLLLVCLLTRSQRVIAGHQIAIIRNVVGAQRSQPFDIVAPVAVQLAGHAEPSHQLRTGLKGYESFSNPVCFALMGTD